jgi:iron-sulfur cluster assembly protein
MIRLTEVAANKVKTLLENRGRGIGIAVGVKTTGCSGLAYTLEYVDQVQIGMTIHESYGVHVYTKPEHHVYLNELEVDYQKKGLNEGFEFINPLEKSRCGCGESFTV